MTAGILLVNKSAGKTSFSLIRAARKKLNIKKVGHAGTLDPFATGVMILLVGRSFTQLSNQFLNDDKEYVGTLTLGQETDTYDSEGQITHTDDTIPTLAQIEETLSQFQGSLMQIPPMYSAKKIAGKKLYELARQGIEIERAPKPVNLITTLLNYNYPHLNLQVACSKGTYIRSLAYDIGQKLGCGAHLSQLTRTRSGPFTLEQCLDASALFDDNTDIRSHLITEHESIRPPALTS